MSTTFESFDQIVKAIEKFTPTNKEDLGKFQDSVVNASIWARLSYEQHIDILERLWLFDLIVKK